MARTKKFKSVYLAESDLEQLREMSGGDDSAFVTQLIQFASILNGLGYRMNGGCLHLAMTLFPGKTTKIRKIYAEKNLQAPDDSRAEGRTKH